MKVRIGTVLPLACVLMAPLAAHAQQRVVAFADDASARVAPAVAAASAFAFIQEPQEMKPEEQMSTSGFFLGIIGMLAGAAVGSQIGQGECPPRTEDKDCMGRHAYTGALIVGTVFVPIGVHVANNEPRNLPLSLLVSAATGTVVYYAMRAIPGEPIAIAPFLAAPLQVVTSVKLERRK